MALSPSDNADGRVLVSGRYEIFPEKSLPDFVCRQSGAFVASEIRGPESKLYALLIDPAHVPRYDIVSSLRRIEHKNLVRVVDWDVVFWPPEGRRRAAVVMERPNGDRVMPSMEKPIEPFKEEPISRRVIRPMVQALSELHYQGVTHRNIRPDNLFYDGNDTERAPIMLGECVSAPAGVNQPVVYETIECGMADPAGRGEGDISNDLYALGVTLVTLLMGKTPLLSMTAEEITALKLMKGSYSALVGDFRVPLSVMEVLRGLLNDDPSERWELEDLEFWIGGRRLSPKQQIMPVKSSRPLEFAGLSVQTARGVADGFARHWEEAKTVVESGALGNWLRRSLSDEDRTEAVTYAAAVSEAADAADADGLLARICVALDPSGPIRVDGFRAMLDGIGPLLTAKYAEEPARQQFELMVRAGVLAFWMEQNANPKPEQLRHIAACDKVRGLIDNRNLGHGVERALYELDPTSPCRSPLFEDDFVVRFDRLLAALERLAATNPAVLGDLIDVHVAAFVASRLKAAVTPELRQLQRAETPFEKALAAVQIIAIIQEHSNGTPAPALCAVAAQKLEPGVDRYHNRSRRAEVLESMRAIATSGSLRALVDTIDDYDDLMNDESNYRQAVAEYEGTVAQLKQIAYDRENWTDISRMVGGQLSTMLSGVFSTIGILIIILMKMF